MTSAGELRHRVTLQSASSSGTGRFGEQTVGGYTDVARVWAAVTSLLSGRDLLEAQQIDVRVSHKVRIRFRAGVSVDDRILLADGRRLEIVTVADEDERHVWLSLMCSEVIE